MSDACVYSGFISTPAAPPEFTERIRRHNQAVIEALPDDPPNIAAPDSWVFLTRSMFELPPQTGVPCEQRCLIQFNQRYPLSEGWQHEFEVLLSRLYFSRAVVEPGNFEQYVWQWVDEQDFTRSFQHRDQPILCSGNLSIKWLSGYGVEISQRTIFLQYIDHALEFDVGNYLSFVEPLHLQSACWQPGFDLCRRWQAWIGATILPGDIQAFLGAINENPLFLPRQLREGFFNWATQMGYNSDPPKSFSLPAYLEEVSRMLAAQPSCLGWRHALELVRLWIALDVKKPRRGVFSLPTAEALAQADVDLFLQKLYEHPESSPAWFELEAGFLEWAADHGFKTKRLLSTADLGNSIRPRQKAR